MSLKLTTDKYYIKHTINQTNLINIILILTTNNINIKNTNIVCVH